MYRKRSKSKSHLLKKSATITIIILLVVFLFFSLSFSKEKISLQVGAYENYPKIFTDDQGNIAGFWPEILEYISSEEGWDMEWKWCIWSDCMKNLENNEIDIMPDVGFTEPRSLKYDFSEETVLVSWSRLYAGIDSPIETILDLENKKIGALAGSFNLEGPEGIRELINNFNLKCTFVEMNNYIEVFSALEKGDIDAGITNKDFGNKNEMNFNIKRTPIIFQPAQMQFAFPKDSELTPILLEKIDSHINNLKKDKGSIYYQSIEKWFAVNYDEKKVIPNWIYYILFGIGSLSFLLLGGNYFLRLQVAKKSKQLTENISIRQKTEKALNDIEKKYYEVIENTSEGFWMIDPEKKTIDVNKSLCNMLGYMREEIIGKTPFDFVDEKNNIIFKEETSKISKAIHRTYKIDLKKKNGKSFPALFNASTLYSKEGMIYGAFAFVTDLTKYKEIQKSLHESEEKYKTIFETSSTPMVIIEEDTIISLVNSKFEKISGYSNKEIEGKKSWTEFATVDDLERMKRYHKERREKNDIIRNYEFKFVDKDKKVKHILISVDMIHGTKKSVASLLDITQRKEMEVKLRNSEEHFRKLSNLTFEGIMLHDQGKLIDFNESLRKIFGYKKEEIFGKNIVQQCALPEYHPIINENMVKGIAKPYEIIARKKNGNLIPIEIESRDIKDKNDTFRVTAVRDISERKQARDKLRKTLHATIETMSKIIEVKDPYTAGHQKRVSQIATAIAVELNISKEIIEGIKIASLIHDIGKIGIPTEILSKSTILSDIEFQLIKQHPQIGYDILNNIDFNYPVAQIILQHHERLDGSGYPNHLKDKDILLEAKIIAVADVVEAMSSHRPYRPTLGIEKALEEISNKKGILYDSIVVDTCYQLFHEKGYKL